MENNLVNTPSFQVKEVEIRDHARVFQYQCNENSFLDFHAEPMDIYLFCVRQGSMQFHVSFIPHPLELGSGEAFFLANPRSEWKMKLQSEDAADFFMIRMDASTLHKLINPAFDNQNLVSAPRTNMKDMMRLIPVNPSIMSCFDQLLHHKLKSPFNILFEQAKFLEIFSQLLETSFGQPMDVCPVTITPAIEQKLSRVRRHIIEHIDESPDPDSLALLYELPRNTLREGYRYVYGKTIHQFYADHKLDSAMEMLNSGEFLVKEVAFKIGYQNPSHFISAFKKKFGYTPKQFFRKESISAS